jgi:lysine 2,3-aminomutase
MSTVLKRVDDLVAADLVSAERAPALRSVEARYAIAIAETLADLIDRSDPSDPIARQFVPSEAELISDAIELADPIGDDRHSPVKGIVHRHRDRVLFKAVSSCPVYCRFCFRRESVGPDHGTSLSVRELDCAIDYVDGHPEIWEVVLTGGDPFILSARRARHIVSRLAAIAHVKVVRWHTRVPFTDPSRVTADFIDAIVHPGISTFVALHANHRREFSVAARTAIGLLRRAGIPLVSQSVLLKGVNDRVETLEDLMRGFVEAGVKPYYLHHPDLAPGTGHFRMSIGEGLALVRELRRRLSGIAMPTYVLDIPGGHAKVALESANVEHLGSERYRICDPGGTWHDYPPT